MTVKCSPKKKNKKHIYVSALFSLGFVACVAFISFNIGHKLAVQVITVAFVASLIWCMMKFFLTERTYTLTDHYGPAMFFITQTQGKRTSSVFETKISDIKDIGVISKDSKDVKLPIGVLYDFRVTLGAEEYQYIVTRVFDKNIVVKIEADEDFWNALQYAYKTHLESALDGEEEE